VIEIVKVRVVLKRRHRKIPVEFHIDVDDFLIDEALEALSKIYKRTIEMIDKSLDET